MIHRIVQFSLRQRPLILLLVAIISIAGIIAFHHMPVDAYPDSPHRWWKSSRNGQAMRPKKSSV